MNQHRCSSCWLDVKYSLSIFRNEMHRLWCSQCCTKHILRHTNAVKVKEPTPTPYLTALNVPCGGSEIFKTSDFPCVFACFCIYGRWFAPSQPLRFPRKSWTTCVWNTPPGALKGLSKVRNQVWPGSIACFSCVQKVLLDAFIAFPFVRLRPTTVVSLIIKPIWLVVWNMNGYMFIVGMMIQSDNWVNNPFIHSMRSNHSDNMVMIQ